ncbi:MAG: GNAT family N-acetyltransferase [Planctomycetes bacterium]|nr:GNAT family N-acetyltransferase [Planctomycetota bacterium]
MSDATISRKLVGRSSSDAGNTPRGAQTATASDVRVEFVQGADALASRAVDCENLAENVAEPNPFFEHWMLGPALRRLAGDEEVVIVLAYGRCGPQAGELLGCFPLCVQRRYKRLPLTHWQLWRHAYCFLCTPLLRTGSEADAIRALVSALADRRDGPALLELGFVGAQGRVASAISDWRATTRKPALVTDRFERAFLRSPASFDAYFHETLDRKRRKEITRLRNRLNEAGAVEIGSLAEQADPTPWIDSFLALEASGWKGRGGTALASAAAHGAYFREVALAAHQRRRLTMMSLSLDGRPIAMKVNFRAAGGEFAFKIAFDEAYAAFSPGLLLELEHIRGMCGADGRWIDSCADADHFMANRIWPERFAIESTLIPLRRTGAWCIRGLRCLQAFRRKHASRDT